MTPSPHMEWADLGPGRNIATEGDFRESAHARLSAAL